MKRVHHHIRLDQQIGTILLFVIEFHYDCEVIVIDRVGIHPVRIDGIVDLNIAVEDQEITDEIYNDVISMLHQDGLC
jgi:hypothetical protein